MKCFWFGCFLLLPTNHNLTLFYPDMVENDDLKASSDCCGGKPSVQDANPDPPSVKKSCCGGGTATGILSEPKDSKGAHTLDSDEVRQQVMAKYGEIASEQGRTCCGSRSSVSSTGDAASDFAQGIGYSAAELADLPEGANMGLSCGNPNAIASLQPGETVLDLGSGGGFDCFIAAKAVGPRGKSLGVDMTPAMIHKARANAKKFQERTGLANVEFRLGEIEHLPVADQSVDCIISNCVINLSPDKPQVWNEVARVLKPGGRACVSDICLMRPLPEQLKKSIHALVGCVAGASLLDDVVTMVKDAGLVVSSAEKESAFVHKMETSDDPLYSNIMKDMPEGLSPRDYVTSLKLVVTKP
jgi:SAM-dependent methyltransferase